MVISDDLREALAARRIWESFVGGGEPDLSRLTPAVRASWLRSRRLGINPELRSAPAESDRPQAPAEPPAPPWLEAAQAPFEFLAAALAAPRKVVLLADAAGRVLRMQAGAKARARSEQLNVRVGANWSEAAVGSTAIGMCLHDGTPAQANWWESWSTSWHDWVAQAVPIRDPAGGRLLGGIDISGFRESMDPAVLAIALQAAHAIEAAIGQADWRSRALLLERYQRVLKNASRNPCLAVDRAGRLAAFNETAAKRFGLADRHLGADLAALESLAELLDSVEDDGFIRRAHLRPEADTMEVGGGHGSVFVAPAQPRPQGVRAWPSRYNFERLWGGNAAFRAAVERARRLAPTEVPVLISGETGTGKELFAHAIHSASERAGGPFVAVNCGAIPQELIASELFGYERGAFTGARSQGHRGKFELAAGGTIFLDEITETSPALQVALLRVIQERELVPVGGERARPADVRVISATNRDPALAVADGVLRKDLFYRLNGAILELPPLRARRDDIPDLVARFCAEAGRGVSVSDAVMELLLAHDWPGNLRELQAVVRNAAALASAGRIEVEDLPPSLHARAPGRDTAPSAPAAALAPIPAATIAAPTPAPADSLSLQSAEAAAIERALAAADGNVRAAAKLLGIGRSSLYRKLQQLQLSRAWTRAGKELET